MGYRAEGPCVSADSSKRTSGFLLEIALIRGATRPKRNIHKGTEALLVASALQVLQPHPDWVFLQPSLPRTAPLVIVVSMGFFFFLN